MSSTTFSKAELEELEGATAAMKRAAAMARKIAIATDTGIVTVRDGQVLMIDAADLRVQETEFIASRSAG